MTNLHYGKNYSILIYLFLILSGCETKKSELEDRFKQNMASAGKNRRELEKVIEHYQQNPRDSLKLKAAIFLIGNMENHIHYGGEWLQRFDSIFDWTASLSEEGIKKIKDSTLAQIGKINVSNFIIKEDLKVLSADYLIENIDQAYEAWQKAPWSSSVSFAAFCDYILPYNSFHENPEKWRNVLRNRYQYILDDGDHGKTMEDICCALVDEEKTWFRWIGLTYPSALSVSNLLKGQRGACLDMANLAATSARALGIPVAIDYVRMWGNGANHAWSALILSDSSFLPFQGAERRPGDFTAIREGENKPAKVFRYTMSYIESSFAARASRAGIQFIPENLSDPRSLDVTSNYNTTADITLDVKAKNGTPVYLCVFHGNKWHIIEGGLIENHKVIFKQLGRDIMYMPMYYKNHEYQPAAPAMIIPLKGEKKELIADETKKIPMKLFRRYPLKKDIVWDLAKNLNGVRFEGSNTPDFKNPTLLYVAPQPGNANYRTILLDGYTVRDRLEYESLWEQADISMNKRFRFVRMIADKRKSLELGELAFYSGGDSLPLTGKPIGTAPNPGWAFDGLPGYNITKDDQTETDHWVGLDLGQSTRISKIRYLPANDNKKVDPDKTYELFYWKDNWVSLGIQKPGHHYLEYADVPSGGLYWLHCEKCPGFHQRPFTYEENKQLFW